jgi:hypothetical protein
LAFTAVGVGDFLELSRGRPAAALPYYGVLPFASREFSAERVAFVVESVSLEGGYADCSFDVEVGVKGEGEMTFGLQVPNRVELAFFKVHGVDEEKNDVYYTGDASVEWMPDRGVSLISYSLKPVSKYPIFMVMVSFRWYGVVERVSYTSYELLIPFSNSDSVALTAARPDAVTLGGTPFVSLMLDLPFDSRITEAVPQPIGETIYWRNETLGHRSLVMEGYVPFGSPQGYSQLQSFRVGFEVPSLRQRYDRLMFDSGLFLGVGVQFLIAGLYDAIKLREK